MENRDETVKNVFRNGNKEPTREHFTATWINLINGIERDKKVTINQR